MRNSTKSTQPKTKNNPVLAEISPSDTTPTSTQEAQQSVIIAPSGDMFYQTFLEWFIRQGEYQRPDLTLFDRLDIARRFYNPQRPWGEVTQLAEEYSVSRVTIYAIAHRINLFFQPHLPGPVAGLKALLNPIEPPNQLLIDGFGFSQIREQLLARIILTSVFPGGMTMRPIEELVAEIPGLSCSDTTIWRFINQAGQNAHQILTNIDFANVPYQLLVAIDETFFNGSPIFFVVEPISLAICGFYVPSDNDHSSLTWAPLMLNLKQDQNLNFIGGMGDGAKSYPKTFKEILKRDDALQGDISHVFRSLNTLQGKLENEGYRAMEACDAAKKKLKKEECEENKQKLSEAQSACEQALKNHEIVVECCGWIVDSLELVDLRSGEIRDREINEWLFDCALDCLEKVPHESVLKKVRRLREYKPRLFTYFNWLDSHLPSLTQELIDYLNDTQLAKAFIADAARHWRLNHQVKSLQQRKFRPILDKAALKLAFWTKNEPILQQWSDKLHLLLNSIPRTSSAVENINSIFKPLVKRKKHFGSSENALNFVALFVLWHNMRRFKEGLRKDKSPVEILGIDLGTSDWGTLLGHPPVQ